jgi:hypothetical protein
MGKTYKVWLEIEGYDTETEESTNVDAPGASLAEFSSYDVACRYAENVLALVSGIKERDTVRQFVWEAIDFCVFCAEDYFRTSLREDGDEDAYQEGMESVELARKWLSDCEETGEQYSGKPKPYTVVGLWSDCWEPFVEHVLADCAHEARLVAIQQAAASGGRSASKAERRDSVRCVEENLEIATVIEGHHFCAIQREAKC